MNSNTQAASSADHGEIKRVLILGCPGAGKTTFARQLGHETGLPTFHLDDFYWGPGWSAAEPDCWMSRQQHLVAQDRWIIDGNYLTTASIRVPKAQMIVILDAPMLTCLARVIARAWRIRRGNWQYLPRQVREEADAGKSVAATKDFLALIWKIICFRYRDAATLLKLIHTNARAARIIAVVPGLLRRCDNPTFAVDGRVMVVPLNKVLGFAVDTIRTSRGDSAQPNNQHSLVRAVAE